MSRLDSLPIIALVCSLLACGAAEDSADAGGSPQAGGAGGSSAGSAGSGGTGGGAGAATGGAAGAGAAGGSAGSGGAGGAAGAATGGSSGTGGAAGAGGAGGAAGAAGSGVFSPACWNNPGDTCNPLDPAACDAVNGGACDLDQSGALLCYPPPNDRRYGQSCTPSGPFCEAGLHCHNGYCERLCCSKENCVVATHICQPFDPSLGTLGFCMTP